MYRTELHSRTRSICPNVKDPQAGRVRSISLLPPKGTNQTCLHRSQAQSCDHSHWGLDRSCCYQLWSEKSKLPPENYDSTNYLLKYRTIHFTSQTFLNRSNYPLTQSGEVLLLRDDPVSLITIMMILGSHVISLLSLRKKKDKTKKRTSWRRSSGERRAGATMWHLHQRRRCGGNAARLELAAAAAQRSMFLIPLFPSLTLAGFTGVLCELAGFILGLHEFTPLTSSAGS